MKRVAFYTLGCKVNQIETEQIKEDFLGRGYTVVDFSEEADVYVINTCTVTHISDRKSRAAVRRAVRKNPGAIIAAIGCVTQINPEQMASMPGVNIIVGNKDKGRIADLIQRIEVKGQVVKHVDEINCSDRPAKILYSQPHQRTRAFVKIQDGCENFCSYCIVPLARGPVRSKLPNDVLEEIQQLVTLGYKEIVLGGIHTGFYGKDLPGWNLVRLVQMILHQVDGDFRLRLSSIEPGEVSPDLISLVVSESRLCRHLHIPMQSGSDPILQAMNRRYTRDYYYNLINGISQKIPGIAFTTDVMVGFPGEGETEYNDTYSLIQDLPITDLHVFKYSPRPGTKAAGLPVQVADGDKQVRSQRLIKLAEDKRKKFVDSMAGQELKVLVEKHLKSDVYQGISDNYLDIRFSSPQDISGQFVLLKLVKNEENMPWGKLNSID